MDDKYLNSLLSLLNSFPMNFRFIRNEENIYVLSYGKETSFEGTIPTIDDKVGFKLLPNGIIILNKSFNHEMFETPDDYSRGHFHAYHIFSSILYRRKIEKTDEKEIVYKNHSILSWVNRWTEYNYTKEKDENKKEIICKIFKETKNGNLDFRLNIPECNDGSKLTGVNQAINQAKEHINICEKHGW